MSKLTLYQRAVIFWRRVAVTANPDDCWLWTGPLKRDGYGDTSFRNKNIHASRLAWILTYGDPGPLVVCHRCDRPACCNPQHLFVGTPGDNVRDCQRKGRGRAHFELGKVHPRYGAKLNPEILAEAKLLYAAGVSQIELGRRYGVHSSTMNRAIRGEHWAHLA